MSTEATIMMIVAMVTVWGGLAAGIVNLARHPEVEAAYEGEHFEFGPEYILPKPVDPRLLGAISAAVAQAAVDCGVARRPYPAHYPLTSTDDIRFG